MVTPLDQRTIQQNMRNFENDMREIDERYKRNMAEIDRTYARRRNVILCAMFVCLVGLVFSIIYDK